MYLLRSVFDGVLYPHWTQEVDAKKWMNLKNKKNVNIFFPKKYQNAY